MKKNIARGIIAVLVAIVLIISLDSILLIKSEDGVNQLKSLYRQNNNTIDALFVGSSHVYCDISTGVLWDNYGIAGYDLGGAEAPSWTSYYHLKEALKTQHPKVIFYEFSSAGLSDSDYPTRNWVENNDYGMKWNSNRLDLLKANVREGEFMDLLFPISAMHGRYADLTQKDFNDVNDSINYKGFDPREMIKSFETTPDVSDVAGRTPITEKSEKYIRKIIELCQLEDIPLVLFVSPYVITDEQQEKFNYVADIADEYGVRVINFNLLYDEFGMDFSTDMAEELHLNYSGNYKFSNYIGKILREEYALPDRHGDSLYDSWEVDARKQRIERTDLELVFNKDKEYWLGIPANEGYESYIYFAQDGTQLEDDTAQYFAKLGIDVSKVRAGDAYIVKNNKIIAYSEKSDDNVFRLATQEENDNILFVKSSNADDTQESYNISLYISGQEYTESANNLIFVYNTIINRYVGVGNF